MKISLLSAALLLVFGVAVAAHHTFEDLDTDQSGALSQEEAAADESLDFEAADTNGDGSLSKEEYEAAKGAAAGEEPTG